MATERLRYLIEAVWSGKGATVSASKDISGVGDAGKKASGQIKSAFQSIGNEVRRANDDVEKAIKDYGALTAGFAAVLTGAAVTAKKAWEALGEGAGLARSREQFERLAASIGESADSMLADMTAATSGMVSQAELIAGAGQIISLGLADTGDGVVRLSNLVSQLGWDMSQVILTFANNSKMRLDALGLSVTDVEERMRKLQDAGMSADAAFDLAVIEAGEAKLALLGDAALTTEGQMRILEVAIQDVKDRLIELAAVQVAPVLAQFTGADTAQQRAQLQALIDAADDADDAFGALQQTANLMNRVGATPFGNVDVIIPLLEDAVDAIARYNAEGMVTVEISRNLTGWAKDYALSYWLENKEAIMANNRALAAANQLSDDYYQRQQAIQGTGPLAPLWEEPFEDGAGMIPNLEHFLKFIETGATSAAAKLAEVRAEYVALIEAGRVETGGFFTQFFSPAEGEELGDFEGIMLDVAAAGGAAGEQILALAGNTDAARQAMSNAAFAQFAQNLGTQVAAGTKTAQDALQELADFMDGFDLDAWMKSQNVVGSGETSTANIKVQTLGVVEGINATLEAGGVVISEAAGEAETKLDELKTASEEIAGPWPYEIDNSSMEAALTLVRDFKAELMSLEGLTVTPQINVGGGGIPAVYAQHGANFTVPAGYNENFPIFASSGEHVVITPAGKQGKAPGGGGGAAIYVTQNIYTSNVMNSPAVFAKQVRRETLNGLSGAMR